MNWPVDMILGGIHDYFNGTIEAEALQSIILVSNPTDIYTRFKVFILIIYFHCTFLFQESSELENRLMSLNATNNFDNTSTIGADAWSPLVAKEVIIEWQRKFTDFIYTHKLNLELDGRAKENRVFYNNLGTSLSFLL
jgi:hypothetical protein